MLVKVDWEYLEGPPGQKVWHPEQAEFTCPSDWSDDQIKEKLFLGFVEGGDLEGRIRVVRIYRH